MKLALSSALGITMLFATPLAANNTAESTKEVTYNFNGHTVNDRYIDERFDSNYNSIKSVKLHIDNTSKYTINFSFVYNSEKIYSEDFNANYFDTRDISMYFIELETISNERFQACMNSSTGEHVFDATASLHVTYSSKKIYTNGVDFELKKMGVNTCEYYPKKENQIVALTDKYDNNRNQNLLVFYVFNPNPKSVYKVANISYCYMDNVADDEELKYLSQRVEIEYLESNGNGCFQKYICTDIPISQTKHKAYKITKLSYSDESYDVFDSVFKFTENNDGTVSYTREKLDIVYLENEKVINTYITTDYDPIYKAEAGKNNVFFGFNVKNYNIKQLLNIEVLYDIYDYEAICYAGANSGMLKDGFSIEKGVFESEWINEKIKKYELILDEEELEFLSKYYPKYYNGESNLNKTIYCDNYNTLEGDWNLIWGKKEYDWHSIINVKNIDVEIEDKNLKSSLLKNFSSNDFIIYIDSFDASSSYNTAVEGRCNLYTSTIPYNDEIYQFFEDRGKPCPKTMWLKEVYGAKDSWTFVYHHEKNMSTYYQTKSVKNLETVRMKFIDFQNNEYDLSVISTPVNGEVFEEIENSTFADDFKGLIEDEILAYIKIVFDSILLMLSEYAWVFVVMAIIIFLVALTYGTGFFQNLTLIFVPRTKPKSIKQTNNYKRKKR